MRYINENSLFLAQDVLEKNDQAQNNTGNKVKNTLFHQKR